MQEKRTLHRARALIVSLSLTASFLASGAEWKIDPRLSFRAGYNDNLRLSTTNEVSTAGATFSPSARFSVATPTSGASGNLRFDFRRFEADSDLNDDNIRFEANSFHNLERSRLGLDLAFVKDTTLDSQLAATGLVFDRVPRQRTTIAPEWSYSLSERTRLSANYGYTDVKYNNSGANVFVDYTVNNAQASLTRMMSEQTTASITLSRSESKNDNDIKSININLQGGASHRFSETLSATLFAGVRRTEVDFSRTSLQPVFNGTTIVFVPVTQAFTNSDSGYTFSASVTKNFLRGETGLSVSRGISNDINGQPIEVTRLSSTNRYRLSEIMSVGLNLELYNSKFSSIAGNGQDRNYYQIQPTFTWAFKQFWSLSGSYRYRKQTFSGSGGDATQNAAYLTLTYDWPRIAVSR